MITKDYRDKKGIMRRVLIPDESTSPEQGIPISVNLDEGLSNRGNSPDFVKRLYDELWARGLVTPSDFMRPESSMLLRSAINAAIQVDSQMLQLFAKDQQANGNSDTQLAKRRTTRQL